MFQSLVRQQQASVQLQKRHNKAASHEAMAQPLLLHAKMWTVVQQTLWQAMAISIMLVGVGVKLCVYNPIAEPHAHYALPLRLLVGVSAMAVFALQLFYSMVIRRRQFYRRPLSLITTQPYHCAVVLLQLIALAAQALLGLAPLMPVSMLAGQAALGLIQCVLLHLHDHKLKVTGSEIHPLAGVPDALEALRLKASRRRLNDRYHGHLSAIVKIQAIGREKFRRASTKMLKTTQALG